VERSGRGLIWGLKPAFPWKGKKTTGKLSHDSWSRIEIWSGDLPIAWYCCDLRPRTQSGWGRRTVWRHHVALVVSLVTLLFTYSSSSGEPIYPWPKPFQSSSCFQLLGFILISSHLWLGFPSDLILCSDRSSILYKRFLIALFILRNLFLVLFDQCVLYTRESQ
jgi:hypothetical protein